MNDDWRLRVQLHDGGHARELARRLGAPELEHDLDRSFDERVVVSLDGSEVFCYAATREQAQRVQGLINTLATENSWSVDFELAHWHPTAEAWEDPDTPLPASDAERAAERQTLMDKEREESRARGYPEFEVRVQCPAHREVAQLADKLRREGLQCVERWTHLLVGALDEDSAHTLAERLRTEAPEGSTVTVEGNPKSVIDEQPSNPFAVLGGLAG